MEQYCVCLLHSTIKEAQTTISLFEKNCNIKFSEGQVDKSSDLPFKEGVLKINDGARSAITIIISFASNQGSGYTITNTSYLFNKFNPSLAILCGTCSGFKEKTTRGDAILVQKSLNYDTCTKTNLGDQQDINDMFGPKDSFISWLKLLLSDEQIKNEWISYPSIGYSLNFKKEWLLRVYYEYQQPDKEKNDWLRDNGFDTKQLIPKNEGALKKVFGDLVTFRNTLKVLGEEKKIVGNKLSDQVVELIETSIAYYGEFPIDLFKEIQPSLHYGHFGCGSALEQKYETDSYGLKTSVAFKKCRSISNTIIGIDRESHEFYQACSSKNDIDAVSIKSVVDHADGDTENKDCYEDYCNQISSSIALQIIKSYKFTPKKETFIYNDIPLLPKNTIERIYQDKQSFIEIILDSFRSKPNIAITSVSSIFKNNNLSLSGMGGVGKSTLAKQFALFCIEKKLYNYIFWIYGDSKENLEKSYTDILQNYLDKTIDGNHNHDQDVIKTFNAAIKKLQGSVLLVYDNVETFKLQDKVIGDRINIIYTTRSRGEDPQSTVLTLGLLSELECIDLFRKWLPTITLDQVNKLSTMLHNLPLAISHSVAYIAQENITIDQYCQEFQKFNDIIVYQDQDYENSNSYERVVGKTISMAIGRIKNNNNELESRATTLMHFMAFLNPDKIESSVLELFLKGQDDRIHGIIDLLNSYSLILIDKKEIGKNYQISIHRVVQRSMLVSEKDNNINILDYIHNQIHSFLYFNNNNQNKNSIVDTACFYQQYNNISQHLSNIESIISNNYRENKSLELGNKLLGYQILMHIDHFRSILLNDNQVPFDENPIIILENGTRLDKISFFNEFVQDIFQEVNQEEFLKDAMEIYLQFLNHKKSKIQDRDSIKTILQFIFFSLLEFDLDPVFLSKIEKYSNLSITRISKINQLLKARIYFRKQIECDNGESEEELEFDEDDLECDEKNLRYFPIDQPKYNFSTFELILDGLKNKSDNEFIETIDSLVKLNEICPLDKEMVENISLIIFKNLSQALIIIDSTFKIFTISPIHIADFYGGCDLSISDFISKLSFMFEKYQFSGQFLSNVIQLSKIVFGDHYNPSYLKNVLQIITEISKLFLEHHFTNIQVDYILQGINKCTEGIDFSQDLFDFQKLFESHPYIIIFTKNKLPHEEIISLSDNILSLINPNDDLGRRTDICELGILVFLYPDLLQDGKINIIFDIFKLFNNWDTENIGSMTEELYYCNFTVSQLSTLYSCACAFQEIINRSEYFNYLIIGNIIKIIYSTTASPHLDKIIALIKEEMVIDEIQEIISYQYNEITQVSTSRFFEYLSKEKDYTIDQADHILDILNSFDDNSEIILFTLDIIGTQNLCFDQIKTILVQAKSLQNENYFIQSEIISIMKLLLYNRNNSNLDLVVKFLIHEDAVNDFQTFTVLKKILSIFGELGLNKQQIKIIFKYTDIIYNDWCRRIGIIFVVKELSEYIKKHEMFPFRITHILKKVAEICNIVGSYDFSIIILTVSTLFEKYQITDNQIMGVMDLFGLLLEKLNVVNELLYEHSVFPEIISSLTDIASKHSKELVNCILKHTQELYENEFIEFTKIPETLITISLLILEAKLEITQVSFIIDYMWSFDNRSYDALKLITNISSTFYKFNLKKDQMDFILVYYANSSSIYTLDQVATLYLQNPIFFKQIVFNLITLDSNFLESRGPNMDPLFKIETYNSEQANYITAKYKKGSNWDYAHKLFKPTKATCIKNFVYKSNSDVHNNTNDDGDKEEEMEENEESSSGSLHHDLKEIKESKEIDGQESNSEDLNSDNDQDSSVDENPNSQDSFITIHLTKLYDLFGGKRIDKDSFTILLKTQYDESNLAFTKLGEFKQYLKDPEQQNECDHIDLIYKSLLNAQDHQLDDICLIIHLLYLLKKDFFCCSLHISNNILRLLYYDFYIGNGFLNSILTELKNNDCSQKQEDNPDQWVRKVIINSFNPKTKFNCNCK
ncbi:hypothetical protein CYY_005411 [Polysphondylium violaceum]|uniref:NB-ARC domain-containing protein n=1 Tax=Polysphondylium violaceum TaxID=133409 RepID=A0A8J4PTK4_9MYCE|nr:hypothetical protein CYY_005411 [Polysphondylium violaceum]